VPTAVSINGVDIGPGQRTRVEIPIARFPTQTELCLPVEVLNGVREGPRLWLNAAIHGDELNGIEIIHRVLKQIDPELLSGSLLAVPIVNVFGFIHQDRYLPDRRDLNRSFPGSKSGSLAAQTANLFMREIVARSTHGVDLHTGSNHRTNLPQVRGDLDDPETRRCAIAFGAPMVVHGKAPTGSLRNAVARKGIPIIVYEAGEPQRFDTEAIACGVAGVLRLMAALGMRDGSDDPPAAPMLEARKRSWIRARRSGILRLETGLGDTVRKQQRIGSIEEVLGSESVPVVSPYDGVIIGHTSNPLVYRGDAVAHLARDPQSANGQ
jgi:predicted deacylase